MKKQKLFTFEIDDELSQFLHETARKEERSRGQVVRRILRKAMMEAREREERESQ